MRFRRPPREGPWRRRESSGSRGLVEAWSLPRGKLAVWQPTGDLRSRDRKPGSPTVASGAAQLARIDAACDAVAHGDADALVTGPVSKEAIVRSGHPSFLGHTEHLQRRLHAREVVMAFWSPGVSRRRS